MSITESDTVINVAGLEPIVEQLQVPIASAAVHIGTLHAFFPFEVVWRIIETLH